MSLLLDALDRAERARREQRSLAHPELAPEPLPGALPETGSAAQGDVATLFELGARGGDRRWPDAARRLAPWALLALLAAGAGAWLWLQDLIPATVPPAPPPAAAAAVPAPQAGATPAAALAPLAAPVAVAVAPPVAAAPATGAAPAALPAAPAGSLAAPVPSVAASAATPPGRSETASRPHPAAAAARHAEADSPAGPMATVRATAARSDNVRDAAAVDIRLFRDPADARPDPALVEAWNSLRAGHLDQAAESYRALEQRLPGNADVQLGLGRIAAEQGQADEARRHYRRALEIDPRNPAAQAGLAVLEPAGGALDSRLRTQAADDPGDAGYALASRLAAAGQWPEAEQAWFEALRSRPDDPDLLCNLAVSLDHLGQAATARQYYQEALAAADRGRPAHFNRAQIEQRLRALDPAPAGNG